jgi:hypothetical protein
MDPGYRPEDEPRGNPTPWNAEESPLNSPPRLGSDGGETLAGDGRERAPRRELSVSRLIGELIHELQQLVRKEGQLATTEVSERLQEATNGAIALGSGSLVAFAGLILLLQAAAFALDLWLREPWLSALIVGGVVLVIGGAMILSGRRTLRTRNLAPRRTLESLRRDVEFARNQTSRTH